MEKGYHTHNPKNPKFDSTVKSRPSSDPHTDAPNASISRMRKLPPDEALIKNTMHKHYIFSVLNKKQRRKVIDRMRCYALAGSDTIFKQNETGLTFFIIAFGRVEVLVNDERVKILTPGESFGDLALLHDLPRSATVKTIDACCLWGLQRDTFKKVVQYSNRKTFQENKKFLQLVPIFRPLQQNERDTLLMHLVTLKFSSGEVIVREGDMGSLMYIIKRGEVTCIKAGKQIRTMIAGDFFGEQALLFNSPRTATVTAVNSVKCLVVSKAVLSDAFGLNLLSVIYRNSIRMALERNQVLKVLSDHQIENLSACLDVSSYKAGEVVIEKGYPKGRDLWMVLNGQFQIEGQLIQPLQCVGDFEMLSRPLGSFYTNGQTVLDCDIATISRQKLQKTIGLSLTDATQKNEALQVLKRVPLFRTLPQIRMLDLVAAFTTQCFQAGQTIFKQGDQGDCFFIVQEGTVDIQIDDHSIRHVSKLDYFGERSILFNDPRSASVVALTSVSCWVLLQRDFITLTDQSVRGQLASRIQLQDWPVKIDDLCFVRQTSRPGSVVVYNREKKSTYILKSIQKSGSDGVRLLAERRLLMGIDHNLVTKLIKTFKDENRVYFLFQYTTDSHLHEVLRNFHYMREDQAIFYAACIANILEHLHQRHIIFRNLRPQTLMLDSEGYIKLDDFSSAKEVSGRTFTQIGTPHYMSPEIISGKGYRWSTDYWSFGVILYEMLTGVLPFGDSLKDPFKIYESILKRKFCTSRARALSNQAKILIDQLLNKNPTARGTPDMIKAHTWFEQFDWRALDLRETRSPYCPEVQDDWDEMNQALERSENVRMSMKWGTSKSVKVDWDEEFQQCKLVL